jgi:hypothetical protein
MVIRLSIAALLALAVLTLGCQNQTSPAVSSVDALLPGGTYEDRIEAPVCLGPPPVPARCTTDPYSGLAYQIVLTNTGSSTFRGTVNFSHQNGTTETVFTFSATAQSGVATLTVEGAPNGSASRPRNGAVLRATYPSHLSGAWPSPFATPYSLTLERCGDYLPYAAQKSDCDFVLIIR